MATALFVKNPFYKEFRFRTRSVSPAELKKNSLKEKAQKKKLLMADTAAIVYNSKKATGMPKFEFGKVSENLGNKKAVNYFTSMPTKYYKKWGNRRLPSINRMRYYCFEAIEEKCEMEEDEYAGVESKTPDDVYRRTLRLLTG